MIPPKNQIDSKSSNGAVTRIGNQTWTSAKRLPAQECEETAAAVGETRAAGAKMRRQRLPSGTPESWSQAGRDSGGWGCLSRGPCEVLVNPDHPNSLDSVSV